MAVGPLVGSLIGLSAMSVVFFLAGAIALAACLPAIAGGVVARADTDYTATNRLRQPRPAAAEPIACRGTVHGGRPGSDYWCLRVVLDVASRITSRPRLASGTELDLVRRTVCGHGPTRWLAGRSRRPKMARHRLAFILRFLLLPLSVCHQLAPVVGTWWPRSRGPGHCFAVRPVVADTELSRGRARTCARTVLHERNGRDCGVSRRGRGVVRPGHLGTVCSRGGGRGRVSRMSPVHLVAGHR